MECNVEVWWFIVGYRCKPADAAVLWPYDEIVLPCYYCKCGYFLALCVACYVAWDVFSRLVVWLKIQFWVVAAVAVWMMRDSLRAVGSCRLHASSHSQLLSSFTPCLMLAVARHLLHIPMFWHLCKHSFVLSTSACCGSWLV